MQLRPARRHKLANLPAREPLLAGDMEKTGGAFVYQIPNGLRRFNRRNRTAKFIDKQSRRLARFPRAAKFFIESAIAGWRGSAVQRCANDGVMWVFQDDLLSFDFG